MPRHRATTRLNTLGPGRYLKLPDLGAWKVRDNRDRERRRNPLASCLVEGNAAGKTLSRLISSMAEITVKHIKQYPLDKYGGF